MDEKTAIIKAVPEIKPTEAKASEIEIENVKMKGNNFNKRSCVADDW